MNVLFDNLKRFVYHILQMIFPGAFTGAGINYRGVYSLIMNEPLLLLFACLFFVFFVFRLFNRLRRVI